MTALSDAAVARLRAEAARPELDPRYTLRGVAGRGGAATIYVAHDDVLDRDVAIKVLDLVDADGEAAARMLREAQILAHLDHPGIVPIHERGTLPDGRSFYVMKLVRGRPLDAAAAALPGLAERLALFGRVLETVAFAHAHGVVHRDLTPANILVGAFGEVMVMDWGAACRTDAADARPIVIGTPGFMAPEQEQGDAVDARADVFALGRLLACLTGPDADAAVQAMAQRAAAASPDDRYPSVEAFAADLGRYQRGAAPLAYPDSILRRLRRWYRRYELPVLLVLAYLVMRAALLVWQAR